MHKSFFQEKFAPKTDFARRFDNGLCGFLYPSYSSTFLGVIQVP